MFWNKKNKLPVTQADKNWIEDNLNWLQTEFGKDRLKETILPDKTFFNYTFTGMEEDAEYVLARLVELMAVKTDNIKLQFFTDGFVEGSNGTIVSSPAENRNSWIGAAGTYSKSETVVIISLEKSILTNPESLIATIAHELCHELLLGENRILENDEFLTDLTAIFFGFGIFIGNSKFKFDGYSHAGGSGWSMNSQGYLPQQLVAYAMAWLYIERKEQVDYTIFLCNRMTRYFKRSVKYLRN